MADDPRPIDGPQVSDSDTEEHSPPAGPPPPLASVGRYRIRRKLGRGGMGDVFEADDPALDRVVALKLIRPGLSDPAQARERFHREARAAAALHHDHIVPVFDFDANGRHPYLVMPLLAGETLKDRLDREPVLPPADVARVGRETAAALAAAHAAGLIHRDVKPSNLWLEALADRWRVRVLDFGLARAMDGRDRVTDPGPSPGTLSYMSPEQSRGDPLDGRSDLYSLGVVLYEAAVGRRPDLGGGDRSPPPHAVRPEVPAALSDVIVRLVQWRPEDRPRTAGEVVAALTALECGMPAAETDVDLYSTVTPQPRRPARPGGRSRWVVPVALVALLVGALVVRAVWPPASGVTAPPAGPDPPAPSEPLRLTALDVRHFAAAGAGTVDRGVLGRDTFAAAAGDQVTVQVRLNRPAYAYLIAFRGDGSTELCFPEDPDAPPPRTDQPRYPSVNRDERYGLREGTGLWVFAAVASDRPLPAFKDWAAARPGLGWRPEAVDPGTVWFDDGQWVEVLTPTGTARGDRGKGEKVAGQSAVVRVTNGLAADGSVAAAVGFAVVPRK